MSRLFIFVIIFGIVLFSIFSLEEFLIAPQPEVAAVENKVREVEVARLVRDVSRSESVDKTSLEFISLNETAVVSQNITPARELKLTKGSVFGGDYKAGSFLLSDMVSNPGDTGYLMLSIGDKYVPYFYSSDDNQAIDTIPIAVGDRVSFVATTAATHNIKEAGYAEITDITSRVIVEDAKVIQVLSAPQNQQDQEETDSSLLIALTVEQVLQLEMARKLGDITLVPSRLTGNTLSVKSSDVIERLSGVRELRAGEAQ